MAIKDFTNNLAKAGYMGGLGLGAANVISANTMGLSTLDFTPSAVTAPFWGAFMDPLTALRTISPWGHGSGWMGGIGMTFAGYTDIEGQMDVTKIRARSKGGGVMPGTITKKMSGMKAATFQGAQYGGPIGFKTLLLGMGEKPGIAARLSIGNMALSTAELVGDAFSAGGLGKATWVKALTNAKSLGVAGMFNIGEASQFGSPDKLIYKGIYKFAGIDPVNIKAGKSIKVAGEVAGETVEKFLPKLTSNALKDGVRLGIGAGARTFTTLAAGMSLYTYWQIFSGVSTAIGTTAARGVGELALTLNQWLEERQGLEFGYGRIPAAMISSAAATERQRAIQASYGAKINPRNRLMGNEASYNHLR
jgi:hypothetical protein